MREGRVIDAETGSPARGQCHPAAATNGRKGEEEWWVGKHEGPRYHPLTTSIVTTEQPNEEDDERMPAANAASQTNANTYRHVPNGCWGRAEGKFFEIYFVSY